MRIPILLLVIVAGVISSAWQWHSQNSSKGWEVHPITIKHPGSPEKGASLELMLLRDSAGIPQEYSAVVQSVYCYDEVCKIDPVTIYWNSIGEYLRYEIPHGVYLEKYEGDAFSKADYEKLHVILRDINSPFRDLKIDEITANYQRHEEEGVDAVSGATIVDLDESSTIEGSSLTCYTLWHWANGSIQSAIQDITAHDLSDEHLLAFLNKNEVHQSFAIQQLSNRKSYSEAVVNKMIAYVPNASKQNLHLFIKYTEGAPADIYFNMMEQLLSNAQGNEGVVYLSSIRKSKKTLPKSLIDVLSSYLDKYKSYQAVDLLISIFEEVNIVNDHLTAEVLKLLESDILIARRAYYFLGNQNLNKEQNKRLNKFYKRNKNYL